LVIKLKKLKTDEKSRASFNNPRPGGQTKPLSGGQKVMKYHDIGLVYFLLDWLRLGEKGGRGEAFCQREWTGAGGHGFRPLATRSPFRLARVVNFS
jgi:hypothetical protein